MSQIEPCTTESGRRRHYSDNLRERDRKFGDEVGRWGQTLCGTNGIDEKEANRWHGTIWGRKKPVVLADLPECRLCAKSKARLERGSVPDGEVTP